MRGTITSLLVLAVVVLLSCGTERKEQPPASPLIGGGDQISVPLPTDTVRVRGRDVEVTTTRRVCAYYLLTIIEDSTAWSFRVMVYDTTFQHTFCSGTRYIQVGAAACNAWGDCSDTSWSEVYEVKPDTLEIPLIATQGLDYNWITVPNGIQRASDLASHIHLNSLPPTPCYSVSRWNPASQTYTIYATRPLPIGDFALTEGEPVRVAVDSTCVWIVEQYNNKLEKWRWTRKRH